MVRADRTAWRTASSLVMSGRSAPARTATETPECTRSARLSATAWPEATRRSIASLASTTMSKASPACTRRAASTPPTDSILTAWPVCFSKADASSASTWRVAMEEMQVIGVVSGMRAFWPRRSYAKSRHGI